VVRKYHKNYGELIRVKFRPYDGDTMGILTNENYLVFRWMENHCKVLFSVTQRGKGAICHMASDKAGLRDLKRAINEFADFLYWLFEWCEVIVAPTSLNSAKKMLLGCGFKYAWKEGETFVCIRRKDG